MHTLVVLCIVLVLHCMHTSYAYYAYSRVVLGVAVGPVTRHIHTFATDRRRTDGLATGEEGSVAMGAGCNPRVALRPPSSVPTCGPSGVLESGGIERRVRERGGSPGASGGPPSPQGPGGRSHRRERGLLLLSSSIVPCLPDHPLQGPPAAVRPLYLPVRPQRGGGASSSWGEGGRRGAADAHGLYSPFWKSAEAALGAVVLW